MSEPSQDIDSGPDILAELVKRLRQQLPQIDPVVLDQAEQQLRQQYGGMRSRIAKRKKFLTADERKALMADVLSELGNEEIQAKHKISRATLFRQSKRFGP